MNANRRTRKPSSGIRSAMFIEPVARFRSPFKTKFGIPRQAGLVPELKGRIVFEPRFRSADAVRGLEGFEYIWLIWGFSGNKPRSAASSVAEPTNSAVELVEAQRTSAESLRQDQRPEKRLSDRKSGFSGDSKAAEVGRQREDRGFRQPLPFPS